MSTRTTTYYPAPARVWLRINERVGRLLAARGEELSQQLTPGSRVELDAPLVVRADRDAIVQVFGSSATVSEPETRVLAVPGSIIEVEAS